MVSSAEILAAVRELTNVKQLERAELHDLLQDGILAALAKKYGPTVQAEVSIDDGRGDIRIVVLKTVVDTITDPAREITVEDARFYDEGFEVGDQLEEPVDFAVFGRAAVQAAKQRIIQRVREGERTRIRDEFSSRVGELLSGEVQQIERGKLVIMLNKFREAEAIIPYREQNHREHFHQGEPIRAVLKRVEETPKGPRLIFSRGDPLFVKTVDLDFSSTELGALADTLRTLHILQAPYPEQSVRGGTQTDRPLFFNPDSVIQTARARITGAVHDYLDALPDLDPTHPLLSLHRDEIYFEGSWSVRLQDNGYHASHTHVMGWISSAFYVSLPETPGPPPAGWLGLGTPPPELSLDLTAYAEVEPKPGRLALFPSTMWHSTYPFEAGERLTVAFDVRRPQ